MLGDEAGALGRRERQGYGYSVAESVADSGGNVWVPWVRSLGLASRSAPFKQSVIMSVKHKNVMVWWWWPLIEITVSTCG